MLQSIASCKSNEIINEKIRKQCICYFSSLFYNDIAECKSLISKFLDIRRSMQPFYCLPLYDEYLVFISLSNKNWEVVLLILINFKIKKKKERKKLKFSTSITT